MPAAAQLASDNGQHPPRPIVLVVVPQLCANTARAASAIIFAEVRAPPPLHPATRHRHNTHRSIHSSTTIGAHSHPASQHTAPTHTGQRPPESAQLGITTAHPSHHLG